MPRHTITRPAPCVLWGVVVWALLWMPVRLHAGAEAPSRPDEPVSSDQTMANVQTRLQQLEQEQA
ncbi:MAG: hypothetical protein JSS02_11330 [Planctomycetes bacterium]|nr:hypothetical protein [Planctomycetota bacterium]